MNREIPNHPAILGIGTALPEYSITQTEAAAMAGRIRPQTAERSRLVPMLYRRSSIGARGSVLLRNGLPGGTITQDFFPSATGDADRGPGTGARAERYAVEAPELAARAARQALGEAATEAAAITHLITVSCTGFSAPGIDAALISDLGLSASVQRTHIGFMGCHGAINGLRVARAFALSEPGARVLLCAVELCSLHFHYTSDPEKMVANALFADGAGATVISGVSDEHGLRAGTPRLAATESVILPDSRDAMTWTIGDHGFEMTLSARVPSLLRAHLGAWFVPWLLARGLGVADVGGWAVHPGGPRVLSTVGECLGLPDAAIAPSRGVLERHGNMSSPTVLFILEELRRAGLPPPWVAMAFGPGLAAEVALLL